MKRFTSFILVSALLICCFTLCSCSKKDIQENITDLKTEAPGESDTDSNNSFKTINDLIIAIQKNPSVYSSKKVIVEGTILKKDDYTAICDLSDVSDLSAAMAFDVAEYSIYRNYKAENKCIDIKIYDDLTYAIVGSGDYVKLSGTVKVADGEVYLDNCECEVIKSLSGRK